MKEETVTIRLLESVSGRMCRVEVPPRATIAELRRLIAAALTQMNEHCEVYRERTGKLLSNENPEQAHALQPDEILQILPRQKTLSEFTS